MSVCVTGKPTNSKWVKWQLERFDLIHHHINDESGQSVTAWELVAILRNSYSEQVANHKGVWVQSSQAEWEKLLFSQACEAQTFFFFSPHHESLDSGDFFKAWRDIENGSVPNDTAHQKKKTTFQKMEHQRLRQQNSLCLLIDLFELFAVLYSASEPKLNMSKQGVTAAALENLIQRSLADSLEVVLLLSHLHFLSSCHHPAVWTRSRKCLGFFCMRVCMIPLCVCVCVCVIRVPESFFFLCLLSLTGLRTSAPKATTNQLQSIMRALKKIKKSRVSTSTSLVFKLCSCCCRSTGTIISLMPSDCLPLLTPLAQLPPWPQICDRWRSIDATCLRRTAAERQHHYTVSLKWTFATPQEMKK